MKTITLALAATTALASPALAQTADQERPGWTPEIVVVGDREGYAAPVSGTATRTDTPLIEVPQSVQVLTRTLIEEQDRRTLGEALVNVSGVTPTRSDEVLFIPPIVRGFAAETYVDGLPVFAGNQQAYDPNSLVGIDRIEVLKGPTATLFGGGLGTPLGGLINLQSQRPGDRLGGEVALRAGDRLARVPESSGRIAARYRVLDGTVKGLSVGAGLSAFTSRELTLPNTIAVPGYVAIDAQASYDIDRFTIGLSAVNLGNRQAFDPYSYLGYPVVAPNQPRSVYATLKVRI